MIFAANIVSMYVLKKKTKTRFYLLWQKSNRIMDYYRAAEIFGLGSSIWKFWGTVSATMSFIVVLVNTLLLHTFIKNPLLRNRKHMMVVNLAVADLIYGLLGIPSLIFSIFNPTPISIIVSSGMITFTKSACLFTLSVIAVERMYSVVWPIRHKLMNSKAYKVAVLAIWIFSMGNTTLSICRRDKVSKFSPFLQPAALFVIVIITSNCYLRIWITLRRRGQCRIGTAARQDRSLALTLLLVTGVFLVTWGIPMTCEPIFLLCKSCDHFSGWYFMCATLLLAVQSLVNPIIYCFRMPLFKMGLKTRLQEIKSFLHIKPRRSIRSRKVVAGTKLPENSSVIKVSASNEPLGWMKIVSTN